MHLSSVAGALGVLAPLALAAPSPLEERQDCKFDSVKNPTCWEGKYNLQTDYYEDAPLTGKVKEYWFELTNSTMAPDGVPRMVYSINGSIPGPNITANWGDTVVVHLKNSLQLEGTSLHFHGVRQHLTNDQDGVASITQCPTIPGDTITYTWNATQYGTSWYHSHYSLQAWDGVFGAIQINGPASAPYDKDLGPLLLSDWTHETSESLLRTASKVENDGVTLNNGLINGKNIYKDSGSRHQIVFEPGKAHRIRLVNTAIDTHYAVTLDNHTMTVISTDFVSIKPFTTKVLQIGIGQRYDVIINATEKTGDYWFRAQAQIYCSRQELEDGKNIKAIVRYDATSKAEPTTTSPEIVPDCQDMPMESLVPSLSIDAGAKSIDHPVEFQQGSDAEGFIHWQIKETPYLSDWRHPTLEQVAEKNTTFDPKQQIVELKEADKWVYAVITNNLGTFHPIHMHGHDFWVVGQAENAVYDPSVPLKTKDAPRRDVAMLPMSGYLVIAFKTDNPGAWLLHCHIGWHTSQGFALTFLERYDEIKPTIDLPRLNDGCSKWNTFATEHNITQPDSGV